MRDEDEQVILVDAADAEIGVGGKIEVHERAQLHRAFSVFLFNDRGETLLQQRAITKYHAGGLWSNSCCGHPRPGEETAAAARRRLREELGIDASLRHIFCFRYRAELDSGLTEHEIDHVFVGRHAGDPQPDPAEVGDWRWVDVAAVAAELEAQPDRFTPWFRPAFEGLRERQEAVSTPAE